MAIIYFKKLASPLTPLASSTTNGSLIDSWPPGYRRTVVLKLELASESLGGFISAWFAQTHARGVYHHLRF